MSLLHFHKYFILIVVCHHWLPAQSWSEELNLEEPLYITPYLENGSISQAKKHAEVHINGMFLGYSGFFNVDKQWNSQMFFWYVPCELTQPDAPVILWLQGGPGVTGLFGLFVEHGPIEYKDGNVTKRPVSWNQGHHVIYVDSPIGAGFSHTFSENGFSTAIPQVANNLYEFILQFFQMFPELKPNDFYLAGESYAGKYIPVFINTIHERNSEGVVINLKGAAIGNPLIDPINQFSYGKYFYSYGLIDHKGLAMFETIEKECVEHILNERWLNATFVLSNMLCTGYSALFNKLTGFEHCTNVLDAHKDDNKYTFQGFLENADFVNAIHVGNQLMSYELRAAGYLVEDICKSVAKYLATALDNYRVVIFVGQMDILVPYSQVRNVMDKLHFNSSAEWATAKRNIWKVNQNVAGTVKSAGNLTLVMVYGAAHSTAILQPENTFDIIKRLTSNSPFD